MMSYSQGNGIPAVRRCRRARPTNLPRITKMPSDNTTYTEQYAPGFAPFIEHFPPAKEPEMVPEEPKVNEPEAATVVPPAEETQPTIEPPKRSLADCWKLYRAVKIPHTVLTDDEIVAMLQSCVDAVVLLEQIDPYYTMMMCDALRWPHGYYDLELIAKGRCIEDLPKMPAPSVKHPDAV